MGKIVLLLLFGREIIPEQYEYNIVFQGFSESAKLAELYNILGVQRHEQYMYLHLP